MAYSPQVGPLTLALHLAHVFQPRWFPSSPPFSPKWSFFKNPSFSPQRDGRFLPFFPYSLRSLRTQEALTRVAELNPPLPPTSRISALRDYSFFSSPPPFCCSIYCLRSPRDISICGFSLIIALLLLFAVPSLRSPYSFPLFLPHLLLSSWTVYPALLGSPDTPFHGPYVKIVSNYFPACLEFIIKRFFSPRLSFLTIISLGYRLDFEEKAAPPFVDLVVLGVIPLNCAPVSFFLPFCTLIYPAIFNSIRD